MILILQLSLNLIHQHHQFYLLRFIRIDDNQQLSDVVDTIEKKLYTVDGIGSVDISGQDTREVHIKLDNNKLLKYGLTTTDVSNAMKKDNVDSSAGKVSDKDNEISIKIDSKIKKVDDFKNILIATKRWY